MVQQALALSLIISGGVMCSLDDFSKRLFTDFGHFDV
jgi:hypothetical protein